MKLIDDLIGCEGGYVDNAADLGGATKWGITQTTARDYGYQGSMRDLSRDTAVAIYQHRYITTPGFDKVLLVSEQVGEELVDTGVNMGATVPGQLLQRILNAMNQQAKLFADLTVDGKIGPATIAALRAVLAKRGASGELVILRALNCLQGARYLEITEARQKNEEFFYGWMLNRIKLPSITTEG